MTHTAKVIIKDPTEHIQKHWAAGTFYEASKIGMLPYIYRHYRGASFIDIGASVGNHTLFFATACQSPRVLSIEPYRPSFEHLKENVMLNNLDDGRVAVVNCGVSDKAGTFNFERYGSSNNAGMVEIGESDPSGTPIHPLDQVVGKRPFDVLKIDVEHHNLPVLRGAERILRDWKMAVFMEAESAEQFTEVRDFLATFGYRFSGKRFNHTATYLFFK